MVSTDHEGQHTNKTHNTYINAQQTLISLGASPNPYPAPTPFIDKLTIILKPANDQDALDLHSAISPNLDFEEYFESVYIAPPGFNPSGFKVNKLMVLPDCGQKVVLQYNYHGKLMHRLRLEINPEKLGPAGLEEMKYHLAMITDGWGYFIKHAHITRADISADFPHVDPSTLLAFPSHATHMTTFSGNGHVGSMVFGKSGCNQTIIYDKWQEQKAKGTGHNGPPALRIERRQRFTGKQSLNALKKLANPFQSLILVQDPPRPLKTKEWTWLFFMSYARQNGLLPALALLEPRMRATFRSHLKAYPPIWWDTDKIWNNWPSFVAGSTLFQA